MGRITCQFYQKQAPNAARSRARRRRAVLLGLYGGGGAGRAAGDPDGHGRPPRRSVSAIGGACAWWCLPQALRVTLPNILNTYLGLFKDTTLVFFVVFSIFSQRSRPSRGDPRWATPVTSPTGYVFAALFYFACCYGMSRYAGGIERRLAAPTGAERGMLRLWPAASRRREGSAARTGSLRSRSWGCTMVRRVSCPARCRSYVRAANAS